MKLIFNDVFLKHDTGNHPENKSRFKYLVDVEQTTIIDGTPYINLVHNGQYIDDVQQQCSQNIPVSGVTLCSEHSFAAAVSAVGATIMASQTGGFALVRPPGHHAFPGRSSGFCIFNNIAIAVQNLVDQGKRVLVFDFDGHFGDGTSSAFYDTDQVLMWSLHQHPAFPDTGDSNNIGVGKGEGFNINVEIPARCGDDVFLDAFNTFLPIAKQFKPDVVAVSAGFDAHKSDMLLDLNVSVDSFYKIGEILKNNFSNIFAVLEGGYNADVLAKGIENFMDGINGESKKHTEKLSETEYIIFMDYETRMTNLILKLRKYWDI